MEALREESGEAAAAIRRGVGTKKRQCIRDNREEEVTPRRGSREEAVALRSGGEKEVEDKRQWRRGGRE